MSKRRSESAAEALKDQDGEDRGRRRRFGDVSRYVRLASFADMQRR
ncbi:MAG: hypothetical protein IH878_08930 [Gemmatimonadetes bacterium]|nr:hypothetical protein [Gemmatimonadota bacterium]